MSFSNSLVLITGAAGMIGSSLVRYLNDQGIFRLLLVDDLKDGEKWKNLVGKKFIDLISRSDLFSFLKTHPQDITAIIHLGACSDTLETRADYLLENNYRFSIRLAEWALSHQKRFIYASSAATYGDGALGFSDEHDLLEHLHPLNMYAYSKHLVDLWMQRENVLDQVVGLKYFNIFGPNEYHKKHMSSMIFKMTHLVQKEGRIHLFQSNDPKNYADGEQKRDFLYVKDAVKMTALFLTPEYCNHHGIYNIGRGIAASWNEAAYALFSALNLPPKIIYDPMPANLTGYQNYTCAEMSKFHKIAPTFKPLSLESSVREYVQDYLLKYNRW